MTPLSDCIPALPHQITLRVVGRGHVPSFKNTKSLFLNRKTGKQFIATAPEKREWMDKITLDFELQLRSAIRTIDRETSMAAFRLCSIASLQRFDDSHQWIPQIQICAVKCAPGEEGATITLELLP